MDYLISGAMHTNGMHFAKQYLPGVTTQTDPVALAKTVVQDFYTQVHDATQSEIIFVNNILDDSQFMSSLNTILSSTNPSISNFLSSYNQSSAFNQGCVLLDNYVDSISNLVLDISTINQLRTDISNIPSITSEVKLQLYASVEVLQSSFSYLAYIPSDTGHPLQPNIPMDWIPPQTVAMLKTDVSAGLVGGIIGALVGGTATFGGLVVPAWVAGFITTALGASLGYLMKMTEDMLSGTAA